jgi:hypothetical protein
MIDTKVTEHMFQIEHISYQMLLVILNFSQKDIGNMEYLLQGIVIFILEQKKWKFGAFKLVHKFRRV